MQFEGKKVLITGAGRGIGQATARVFLERGATVAINDLTEHSVAASITALGGERLVAATGDVASVAGCKALVAAALDGLGGLDVLVNNAGVYREASIADTDEAMWDFSLGVNLKGTFFTTQAAVAALRAEGGGAVVNLASEASFLGNPQVAAYCAAKAGVLGLTRALAMELAPTVRVTCVCPSPIKTNLFDEALKSQADAGAYRDSLAAYTPQRRMGEPEEVARAIAFLASPDASLVTGTALMVEGGVTAGFAG